MKPLLVLFGLASVTLSIEFIQLAGKGKHNDELIRAFTGLFEKECSNDFVNAITKDKLTADTHKIELIDHKCKSDDTSPTHFVAQFQTDHVSVTQGEKTLTLKALHIPLDKDKASDKTPNKAPDFFKTDDHITYLELEGFSTLNAEKADDLMRIALHVAENDDADKYKKATEAEADVKLGDAHYHVFKVTSEDEKLEQLLVARTDGTNTFFFYSDATKLTALKNREAGKKLLTV